MYDAPAQTGHLQIGRGVTLTPPPGPPYQASGTLNRTSGHMGSGHMGSDLLNSALHQNSGHGSGLLNGSGHMGSGGFQGRACPKTVLLLQVQLDILPLLTYVMQFDVAYIARVTACMLSQLQFIVCLVDLMVLKVSASKCGHLIQ